MLPRVAFCCLFLMAFAWAVPPAQADPLPFPASCPPEETVDCVGDCVEWCFECPGGSCFPCQIEHPYCPVPCLQPASWCPEDYPDRVLLWLYQSVSNVADWSDQYRAELIAYLAELEAYLSTQPETVRDVVEHDIAETIAFLARLEAWLSCMLVAPLGCGPLPALPAYWLPNPPPLPPLPPPFPVPPPPPLP